MTTIFFSYGCCLLIGIISIYLTGHIFAGAIRFYHQGKWTSLFFRLLTGLIITVTGLSLYITRFHTVNLVFIILAPFFLFDYFRSKSKEPVYLHRFSFSLDAGMVWSFILCSLVVFSIRFYFIYDVSGIPYLPNPDSLFHSNVSKYLSLTGKENVSLDFLNLVPHANDPYHYFDLWVNVIWIRFFGLNPLIAYVLLTVSIGIIICWTGLMAITEKIYKINFLTGLFCFVFLFFSGLIFTFYTKIDLLKVTNVFAVNPFIYNKLVIIFLILIAALLFFLHQRIIFGITSLAVIPAIFVSTSVSIMPAICIFALKYFFDNRNTKIFLKQVLPVMLVFLFLILFYSSGGNNQTLKIRSTGSGLESLLTFDYLKTSVNIIGLTSIQMVVLYFPVIILIIINFKSFILLFRTQCNFIWLIVSLYVFSLGAWATLHYMTDTVQLFSNISMMVMNILSFCAILFLLNKTNGVYFTCTLLVSISMIGCCMGYDFSVMKNHHNQAVSYMQKTIDAIKGKNPAGVFILGRQDYSNVFSRNPIFNIGAKYLAFFYKDAYSYSLSVYDTPVSPDIPETENHLISISAFYHFVENQKMQRVFLSIPQSQLDFIDTFKIDYLVVSKNATIDSLLHARISREITDSMTGERFCLLKKK